MNAHLLFEVAWEVCSRIGGIYTVIKTKAPAMLRRWNSGYILIGPYNPETAALEFEESEAVEPLSSVLKELESVGIKAHYGRWLIEGKPQVILIDFRSRLSQVGADKYFLWEHHGISTPDNDGQLNDCIAFGFCLTEFFRILSSRVAQSKIVAHCHEWMAGICIPRIRHIGLPVKTIFTTHATLLGRYIASDNPRFYDELSQIDQATAARHYNIEARHGLERLAAQSAHIFTTISEVTARETEQFHGRKPDYLLPNGLNVERFTALHEFQNLHLNYKERIHEFTMGHFFPSYTFDLDRTIYIVTSGRYEYRNKGMDVFLEALYRLNIRLKEIYDPPTIVAFIITNAETRSVNVTSLQNHARFEDLKTTCAELEKSISKRILNTVASGRFPEYEELVANDFQVRLKRVIHSRRSKTLPPIVTHDMVYDAQDPVLQHLRHRKLFNAPTDPVKVVFHPEFLTATGSLFNLDYDQFVRGCHLGVFPSYYEPWGYTPLECLALGIPTVTTDLTGFGDFAARAMKEPASNGIYVLSRSQTSPDHSIEELTSYLYQFIQQTRRQRIELRNKAERISEIFDWSKLGAFYYQAQEAAFNA